MTLPQVAGWIIDFRTARAVFATANALHIAHCQGSCCSGFMHICHCEQSAFASIPALKAVFDNNVIVPDEEIMARCVPISTVKPYGRKQIVGNQTAVFMAAIASSRNYGVITDHQAPLFATAYDLCLHYGIPCLRSNEYFYNI